jgi:Holliday junction resolvasome RuvABC endonuclease subunit
LHLLALDQANHTGYAIFYDKNLIHYGIIDISEYKTYLHKKVILLQEIAKLIEEYKIDYIVFEETYMMPNPDTYKKLNELQVVIKDMCEILGMPYTILNSNHWVSHFIAPTKVPKKREDKKEIVQKKVKEIFNIDVDSDIADAIGMGWVVLNENNK